MEGAGSRGGVRSSFLLLICDCRVKPKPAQKLREKEQNLLRPPRSLVPSNHIYRGKSFTLSMVFQARKQLIFRPTVRVLQRNRTDHSFFLCLSIYIYKERELTVTEEIKLGYIKQPQRVWSVLCGINWEFWAPPEKVASNVVQKGLPWWLSSKESPANAVNMGPIPGPGRSHML